MYTKTLPYFYENVYELSCLCLASGCQKIYSILGGVDVLHKEFYNIRAEELCIRNRCVHEVLFFHDQLDIWIVDLKSSRRSGE